MTVPIRRLYIVVQCFLLIAGLGALGYTAFDIGARHMYQARENELLNESPAVTDIPAPPPVAAKKEHRTPFPRAHRNPSPPPPGCRQRRR